MKSSLEYSLQALEAAPEQVHFRFNVAFVQIQIASLAYGLPESGRTLVDVEAAAQGLDEAIETLMDIAKGPNPPFPRNDIEQRANMGKNTMRKQLERATTSQREYEEKNAARLEQARGQREAEIKKREDEKRAIVEAALAQKAKIKEERERIAARDREIIEDKMQEAERKAREEEANYTTDEETGERRKREKKKAAAGKPRRGKKAAESDDDLIDDRSAASFSGGSDDEHDGGEGNKKKSRKSAKRRSMTPAEDGEPKKRRKLMKSKAVKESAASSKFKSSERIVDSDEDEDVQEMDRNEALAGKVNAEVVAREEAEQAERDDQLDQMSDEEDEAAVVAAQSRRKKRAVVVDEDESEVEDKDVSMVDETAPAAGSETGGGD